jgi:hypothetical protein
MFWEGLGGTLDKMYHFVDSEKGPALFAGVAALSEKGNSRQND